MKALDCLSFCWQYECSVGSFAQFPRCLLNVSDVNFLGHIYLLDLSRLCKLSSHYLLLSPSFSFDNIVQLL